MLRIRDVYPGSRILIFVHPGSRIQKQQQKRGVKKLINYINFELVEKKMGNFTKKYRTFYPKKLSLSSQKYGSGIRDPKSRIRKNPILDSGSRRGQKGTGSRIRIRNTDFSALNCFQLLVIKTLDPDPHPDPHRSMPIIQELIIELKTIF